MAVTRDRVLPVAVAGPVLARADVDAWQDFFDHISGLAHAQGFIVDVGVSWNRGQNGAAQKVNWDCGGEG